MKQILITLVVVFGILSIGNIACGQVTFSGVKNYPINGTLADHLTAGDFNNDGKIDVAVATGSYASNPSVNTNFKLFIYLQDSSNTLQLSAVYPYYQKYDVSTISSGDINNDGLSDVVLGAGDEIIIYHQNTVGKLGHPINIYAGKTVDAVKIGDINDDGINDIVVSLWNQPNIVAYYCDSIGCLSLPYYYPSTQSGYDDIEIAKLGSDSFNSVIKMNGQGGFNYVSVYKFRKDRSIEMLTNLNIIPDKNNPSSIVVGNISSDNRKELVYSVTGKIGVWGANSDISFDIDNQVNPGALSVGDLNSDGYDDIVMISSGRVQVVINKVVTVFNTNSPNNNDPDGIVVADVNNDGKPDIVSVNSYTGLSVLINTTGDIHTAVNQINNSELKIFPNPCIDILNIENTKEGEMLTIIDSTSRVIQKTQCNAGKTVIGLPHKPGIYFVNVSGKTLKVIKK